MVKELMTHEFESEVIGSDKPALVDFWASWCNPCKMMAPIFAEAESEIGNKIKFFKVNVEEERELAQLYGVMSIPTLILFKEGEEVLRLSGVRPKENIIAEIEKFAD